MPVYQLRIKLRGMSPPIWRRVLVEAESSVADLHEVIQCSMGWDDDHLHQFVIRGRLFNAPRQPGSVDFGGCDLKLSAFGFRVHQRFAYEYDFAVSPWCHDIRVEKVLDEVGKQRLPVCLAGVGACPIEGFGPTERFMDALDEHGEYDFHEWLDERFERLREDLDVEAFQEELLEWQPWVDRTFDRKAANARLQNREVAA